MTDAADVSAMTQTTSSVAIYAKPCYAPGAQHFVSPTFYAYPAAAGMPNPCTVNWRRMLQTILNVLANIETGVMAWTRAKEPTAGRAC